MKKAIVALLLVICAATLFAATTTQTIILMSVVEQVRPDFILESTYVENGYVQKTSKNEISVFSHNVRENVRADFQIWQTFSRYTGEVEIKVSATELYCGGYHTEGLRLTSWVSEVERRHGSSDTYGNCVDFNLIYDGGCIQESVVAGFTVEYQGSDKLPEGTYMSQITMVIESK